MTITPITNERPACLGALCPQHNECARWHALQTLGSAHAIGTCLDDDKAYPLFVQRKDSEVPA